MSLKTKILFLFIVFFLMMAFSQSSLNKDSAEKNIISKVCIKERCFNVEIADTARKREVGLMNRSQLNPTDGMLFVFDTEDRQNFWMKNTLIPLDMIWIDKDKKIVYVEENAQPCRTFNCDIYSPTSNAKYVLEINGGLSKELGFKTGDKVDFANDF